MWFLSQFGLQQQETEAYGLELRFQEFMQTAEECVAEAHGQAEQERGRVFRQSGGSEIPFAHHGLCTKTLSHQTMPQQARKLMGIRQQRVSLT